LQGTVVRRLQCSHFSALDAQPVAACDHRACRSIEREQTAVLVESDNPPGHARQQQHVEIVDARGLRQVARDPPGIGNMRRQPAKRLDVLGCGMAVPRGELDRDEGRQIAGVEHARADEIFDAAFARKPVVEFVAANGRFGKRLVVEGGMASGLRQRPFHAGIDGVDAHGIFALRALLDAVGVDLRNGAGAPVEIEGDGTGGAEEMADGLQRLTPARLAETRAIDLGK
jgi:hypothetical protein